MSQQAETERLQILNNVLSALSRDADMFISYLRRALTSGYTSEDLESLITMIEELNKEVQFMLAALTSTTTVDYISAKAIIEMIDELINKYSESYEAITRALYTSLVTGQATQLADIMDHAVNLKSVLNSLALKLLVLFPAKERLTPPPLHIGYGMSEELVRVLSVLMSRGEVTKGEVRMLLGGDDKKAEDVINELISRGLADKFYDPRHAAVVLKYKQGRGASAEAKA